MSSEKNNTRPAYTEDQLLDELEKLPVGDLCNLFQLARAKTLLNDVPHCVLQRCAELGFIDADKDVPDRFREGAKLSLLKRVFPHLQTEELKKY
ncbi:hypothetical protein [Geminisphaera colitermitum]|uniref:hypothetical protein n=1 Tax=Geminisphaera colitermitum TaxID=1148786 RepID=UPI000158CFF1|nr:hypothetical protein [Geminisphaera colitermitum]RRK02408.1 hypothetical protein Ga0100230_004485 [Opitutaceae bacterium TAV3]RRK02577.1 hypothetical protein Ga0100230_005540 [Opitutaceae bacterium TAV3]